jgi:hypothetical protein
MADPNTELPHILLHEIMRGAHESQVVSHSRGPYDPDGSKERSGMAEMHIWSPKGKRFKLTIQADPE